MRVGRDRGRERQPGKGQRSVCVGVWVWCEGPCVWAGCVCGVGGMGVCMCVWRAPVGAGAETEAERHSQAKDNKVCVRVRACVRGRGGALLSLIGMFTNLSNANIKVSSWLLKGNV